MVTQTQSYLCGSAPVQKTLSKPLESRGESSQGAPAMERLEEARQRHSEGLHLGSNDVRASAGTAKHVSRSPLRFHERKSMRLASRAIRVPRAITWRKRLVIFTDEVSRRPRLQVGVMLTYKAPPKGLANALVWRRSSQQPPLQRWQQIGSSSCLPARVKRETSEKVS